MYLGVSGELSPASVYVSLLPVVEACVVVVAVPGRVGMTNHPNNLNHDFEKKSVAHEAYHLSHGFYH